MIREDGKTVVYLPTIDYGEDDGGLYVISVHDTHEGAIKALNERNFVASCQFASHGQTYIYKGKTVNDCPYGYIDEVEVRP